MPLLTWYNSQHGNRYVLTVAAPILVLPPIMVVYLLFQRWMSRGISMTGIK